MLVQRRHKQLACKQQALRFPGVPARSSRDQMAQAPVSAKSQSQQLAFRAPLHHAMRHAQSPPAHDNDTSQTDLRLPPPAEHSQLLTTQEEVKGPLWGGQAGYTWDKGKQCRKVLPRCLLHKWPPDTKPLTPICMIWSLHSSLPVCVCEGLRNLSLQAARTASKEGYKGIVPQGLQSHCISLTMAFGAEVLVHPLTFNFSKFPCLLFTGMLSAPFVKVKLDDAFKVVVLTPCHTTESFGGLAKSQISGTGSRFPAGQERGPQNSTSHS